MNKIEEGLWLFLHRTGKSNKDSGRHRQQFDVFFGYKWTLVRAYLICCALKQACVYLLTILWEVLSQNSFSQGSAYLALGGVSNTLRERGNRLARIEFTLQEALFSFCGDFISQLSIICVRINSEKLFLGDQIGGLEFHFTAKCHSVLLCGS